MTTQQPRPPTFDELLEKATKGEPYIFSECVIHAKAETGTRNFIAETGLESDAELILRLLKWARAGGAERFTKVTDYLIKIDVVYALNKPDRHLLSILNGTEGKEGAE